MIVTPRATAQPKTVVGAIVNGAAILRHLGARTEPQGVTAIAQALGLSSSTCFNILRTLVAEDLVEFDERRKTYSLGLGLYDLARQSLSRSEPFSIASPRLQELVENYALTGSIWRRTPDERLALIGFVESDAAMRIHMQSGQRLPRLAGASGRCFAAAQRMSRAEIAAEYADVRSAANLPLATFLEEVERAREAGWAVDVNGFVQGVTSIAAPIIDDEGQLRYTVTATMFSGQHEDATVEAIGREIRDLANYVGNRLYGTARRLS